MSRESDDQDRTKTVILTMSSEGPEIDMPALLDRGWRYQDISWVRAGDWDYFMAALGERGVDYHILAKTTSPAGTVRGQIVFSPKAVENMTAYRALHPLPGTPIDA